MTSKAAEFPMPFSKFLTVVALLASAWAQTAPQSSTPANPPQKSNPAAERERSGADPLLDLPPLPQNRVTLIGGTVAKLDPVRDHMAVRAFGGSQMDISFDMRTKVFRDGLPTTSRDIKPGSRVYVDTMLNGTKVFAKTIRIETKGGEGDARGQVVGYDSQHGILSLREKVSPEPVRLHVTPKTTVQMAKGDGSVGDIRPGALVVVNFALGSGARDEAQQIRVLANPGDSFTFSGRVTFVDMRSKRIAIDNKTDNENYEIGLGSLPSFLTGKLREGVDATVNAVFDGTRYQAQSLDVNSPQAQKQEKDKE
jgi:hypothetical protein